MMMWSLSHILHSTSSVKISTSRQATREPIILRPAVNDLLPLDPQGKEGNLFMEAMGQSDIDLPLANFDLQIDCLIVLLQIEYNLIT
jgi:hypothetical protein